MKFKFSEAMTQHWAGSGQWRRAQRDSRDRRGMTWNDAERACLWYGYMDEHLQLPALAKRHARGVDGVHIELHRLMEERATVMQRLRIAKNQLMLLEGRAQHALFKNGFIEELKQHVTPDAPEHPTAVDKMLLQAYAHGSMLQFKYKSPDEAGGWQDYGLRTRGTYPALCSPICDWRLKPVESDARRVLWQEARAELREIAPGEGKSLAFQWHETVRKNLCLGFDNDGNLVEAKVINPR